MALLIAAPGREGCELARRIRERDPEIDLRVWPDLGDPADIEFVLAWNPPAELFGRLQNLRAVSSLGAGVDGLIGNREIPPHVAIGRLAGPRLAADMAAYLVAIVVAGWKRLPQLARDQKDARWRPQAPAPPPAIGLLGTGRMGRRSAAAFAELGFPVYGYSRSGRGPGDIEMYSGARGLLEVAARSDYLINLLPLTDATCGVLCRSLFSGMKQGSTLINVGRGEHLVEQDLPPALDAGRPACAVLDVFRTEPLPVEHPFWSHPRIFVTPHCASVTRTDEAAELAVESHRRVIAGKPPLDCVDRVRGY